MKRTTSGCQIGVGKLKTSCVYNSSSLLWHVLLALSWQITISHYCIKTTRSRKFTSSWIRSSPHPDKSLIIDQTSLSKCKRPLEKTHTHPDKSEQGCKATRKNLWQMRFTRRQKPINRGKNVFHQKQGFVSTSRTGAQIKNNVCLMITFSRNFPQNVQLYLFLFYMKVIPAGIISHIEKWLNPLTAGIGWLIFTFLL